MDRCLSTFLQFGPFLLRLTAYTKLYADARTQSSGKSSRKQSTTNEASGFQPLLSRRCKFRELPSASQHFVVRHQCTKTETSLPKTSGLASSQRCASEMYDITSFADSVLPAPDSPLINTTYQWKMQATCAVPVCLSACVLHVYEYVMYVRTSIHPRAPEMVKARNGLTGSSMLLKALSNFSARKHS